MNRDPEAADPASFYQEFLPDDEQKRILRLSSAAVDLSDEIRLTRTLLAILVGSLPGSHKEIGAMLTVLVRMVQLQGKGLASDWHEELCEVAERVLREMEEADGMA